MYQHDREFSKVDGFVVYREYYFHNPLTEEPDCTREVLYELQTEDKAKECVEEEAPKYPDDKVYYEEGTITI